VQTPKPTPSSFAREAYFGVTAVRFANKDGASRYGRYRIVPEPGVGLLPDAAVAARSVKSCSMNSRRELRKGRPRFAS
jgi:catalase